MDDLDGDNPDFKKTLILKRNQQSMEGRQNQVRKGHANKKCPAGFNWVRRRGDGRACSFVQFSTCSAFDDGEGPRLGCASVLRTVYPGYAFDNAHLLSLSALV